MRRKARGVRVRWKEMYRYGMAASAGRSRGARVGARCDRAWRVRGKATQGARQEARGKGRGLKARELRVWTCPTFEVSVAASVPQRNGACGTVLVYSRHVKPQKSWQKELTPDSQPLNPPGKRHQRVIEVRPDHPRNLIRRHYGCQRSKHRREVNRQFDAQIGCLPVRRK